MAASQDLLKLFLKFSISERLFVSSFDFYFSCRIVGCLGLAWFGLPCLALSCLALSGLVLAHLALPSAAGVAASKDQLDRLLARRCPARRGCRLGNPTPGASGRPPPAPPSLGPLGLPWAWVPLGMGPVGLPPPWAWPGGLWEPLWAPLGLPGGGPRGLPRPLRGGPRGAPGATLGRSWGSTLAAPGGLPGGVLK